MPDSHILAALSCRDLAIPKHHGDTRRSDCSPGGMGLICGLRGGQRGDGSLLLRCLVKSGDRLCAGSPAWGTQWTLNCL